MYGENNEIYKSETYTYIYIYIYIHIYIYIYIHIYMCIYIYIYAYICSHIDKLVNIIELVFGSQLLSKAALHLVGMFIYSQWDGCWMLYAAVFTVAFIVYIYIYCLLFIYSLLFEGWILCVAPCCVGTLAMYWLQCKVNLLRIKVTKTSVYIESS